MPIDVTIKIKCSRCEREQVLALHEDSTSSSFHHETHKLIHKANECDQYGWEWLDENGKDGFDQKLGLRKILCSPCAQAYKEYLKQRDQQDRDFFGNPIIRFM